MYNTLIKLTRTDGRTFAIRPDSIWQIRQNSADNLKQTTILFESSDQKPELVNESVDEVLVLIERANEHVRYLKGQG